jgi:hypothetical protein
MTYNINNLDDLCKRSLQNVRRPSEDMPKQEKRDSDGSAVILSLLNMATIRDALTRLDQEAEDIPTQENRDSDGSRVTSLLNIATLHLTRLDQEAVEISAQMVDPLLQKARRRSSRTAEAARRVIEDDEQWKKIKLAMKGKSTMMLKQNLTDLLTERMRDIRTAPARSPSFKTAARPVFNVGSEKWTPKMVHAPKRWSISEERIRHSTIVSSLEKMKTFDFAKSA